MSAYMDAEIAKAIQTVSEALEALDEALHKDSKVHNLYVGGITLMTEDQAVATFWSEDLGLIMSNVLTGEEANGEIGKRLKDNAFYSVHLRDAKK